MGPAKATHKNRALPIWHVGGPSHNCPQGQWSNRAGRGLPNKTPGWKQRDDEPIINPPCADEREAVETGIQHRHGCHSQPRFFHCVTR